MNCAVGADIIPATHTFETGRAAAPRDGLCAEAGRLAIELTSISQIFLPLFWQTYRDQDTKTLRLEERLRRAPRAARLPPTSAAR